MDRRKMLALLGISPALVAGTPAYAGPAGRRAEGASYEGSDETITVMNPGIANKVADRVPLAPRLKDLNNKMIYMVNLAWEGPDAANYFYDAMTDWFHQHYTGVQTKIGVTAEGMFGTDPALIKSIKDSHADAAVVGVAG
ncbi:MAG TPA: hypothetical protein VNK23_03130 [Candidatus Dormibacteraeota bacterium]|nr:hypothetical protein [Candidatus Dormibacteraeota bacterium]